MFMISTIQRKTFVLLMTFFLIFLGIHVVYELKEIKSRSFNTLDKMNTTLNTVISEYSRAYIYNQDIKNIQSTIDAIESDYVKSIYILDEEANVIVESKKPTSSKIRHPKFDKLLATQEKAIKTTNEYLILNTFSILDIPIGYMVLEADLKTYHGLVDEEMDEVLLEALLWFILFLVLSMFIAKGLSRPIHDIIDRLGAVKDSEVLDFPYQTQKEFQYLCENVAKTHNRLRASNKNLEAKVDEKIHELQDLNRSLESRVNEEVEKNRLQNEKMFQQSRLAQMGEMISMIAHQWRQPLGAISATVLNLELEIELEEFDLTTKEGVEKYNKHFFQRLETINGFVHDLTVIIDDFRNFYKPNKKSKLIQLDEVVLKALGIIKISLQGDKIEILEHYNSSSELEMFDSEMMQVILNILKNSQDNFREKNVQNSKITIEVSDRTLSICDNGGGIPEDIIDNIFDPYFSTKDEKNGTGLGLYMSKIIIEEHHNASLSVKNKDNGVCFTIDFNNRKDLK